MKRFVFVEAGSDLACTRNALYCLAKLSFGEEMFASVMQETLVVHIDNPMRPSAVGMLNINHYDLSRHPKKAVQRQRELCGRLKMVERVLAESDIENRIPIREEDKVVIRKYHLEPILQ
jgi:hypothetical protein